MTNYKKAWDAQLAFDNRVKEERNVNPSVQQRCAAFRIEIGELANELPKVFKWWSKKENNYDKALVEYVDGEKFLIGLGIELGVDSKDIHVMPVRGESVEELHSDCDWLSHLVERGLSKDIKGLFNELFSTYVKLGHEIGFNTDEVMKAFEDKHEVINSRLENGY